MTTTATLGTMTADTVFRKILNKESLFILDVRNEEAYADWKIEGATVTSLNIPYFDLLDGVNEVLDKLPKDQEILVVCAKEGSSEYVGEQLVESGMSDVSHLLGGMQTWSEYLYEVQIGELKNGTIHQFVRVGKGCLSYAIVSDGEVAFVDTSRTVQPYLDFAKQRNLKIKYVMDTHLHADHISGGRLLSEASGAIYLLPEKDAVEATFSFEPLQEQQRLIVGKTQLEISPLYSPGHTIGSTSLIVDNRFLLTGDILFVDSIGRPDLAGKAEDWVDDLRESLYIKYKLLSRDLIVLPAHFAKQSELDSQGRVLSTLGNLFKENKGLQIEDESAFRKLVTENLPAQPNAYQEIRLTNMGKMSPSQSEASEMEIGPNRCAVHG